MKEGIRRLRRDKEMKRTKTKEGEGEGRRKEKEKEVWSRKAYPCMEQKQIWEYQPLLFQHHSRSLPNPQFSKLPCPQPKDSG
jgi:hypothetical protein